MKILKNYLPKEPQFFTENVLKTIGLPAVILEGKSEEEIKELLKEIDAVKIEYSKTATRLLDEFEKKEIRAEYGKTLEEELPEAEENYALYSAEAKRRIKELKAIVDAAMTKIKDLAYQAKLGTKQIELNPQKTYRVIAGKQFAYYSIINGRCVLAKVEDIPEDELSKWYNQLASKKAEEIFGIKIEAKDAV